MSVVDAYSYSELLDATIVIQAVLSFCYLMSSFPVSANGYAGFVSILMSLVYCLFTVLSYYGLRVSLTRKFFGFVLGASVVLVFVSLENSIFWGQYAGCEPRHGSAVPKDKIGVECKHVAAMKALCAFSVFLFLSYIFLVVLLMRFKDELLGSVPSNLGYSPVSTVIPPVHPPSGDFSKRLQTHT